MKEALQSRHPMNAVQSESIVRLAMGNYARAAELIRENEEDGFLLATFREFMLAGYMNNITSGMKTVEALSSLTREKQKAFLDYSLGLIRENAVIHLQEGRLSYMNRREEEFSANFSRFIKGSNLAPLAEEFNKAAYDIERNGNSKIVLLDLMLKAGKLLRQ